MKKFLPIFIILIFTVISYFCHKLLFAAFPEKFPSDNFYLSLEKTYLFYATSSIVVISILLLIKDKLFDNLGMVFLIVSSIKMILCYGLLRMLVNPSPQNISIEKTNFFVMFLLFLAMETVITIRILNNKQ